MIQYYHKNYSNDDSKYIIVDKQKGKLYLCSNGDVIKSYNCGVGINGTKLDDETYTWSRNGKIVNGSGNMSTTAGLFFATPSRYKGHKSFMLQTQKQIDNGEERGIATAIHIGLNDSSKRGNAQSNGCVRVSAQTADELSEMLKDEKHPRVYIMPVEEGNYFRLNNNRIEFISNDTSSSYSRGSWDNSLNDGRGGYDNDPVYYDDVLDLNGNPVRRNATPEYRPKSTPYNIKIIYDINDIRRDLELRGQIGFGNKGPDAKALEQFVNGLTYSKKELMRDCGISNETYNQLAKIALGILGQETSYGSLNYEVVDWMKGIGKLFGGHTNMDYRDEEHWRKHTGVGGATFGITQINWNAIQNNEAYADVKQMFKKYNISVSDLTESPYVAA